MGETTWSICYQAQNIYKALADEQSKELFTNRILYNMTYDPRYLLNILVCTWGNQLKKLGSITDKSKVVIYGAGSNCDMAIAMCEALGIQVDYICDKDKKKQMNLWHIKQLPVISPEELVNSHKDAFVIISAINYQKQIMEYLMKYISNERIIPMVEQWNPEKRTQYFDSDIINLSNNEIFIDGGGFDFDTSKILLSKCDARKIFVFEPDEKNCKKIHDFVDEYDGDCSIEIVEKGLWNETDTLYFSSSGTADAHLDQNGQDVIEVAAIDDIVQEAVSFIKMDIEGAEKMALEGAKKTIISCRPKLAICIYHRWEDIIDIPAYVLSLVPEYKLYIRHYSWVPSEMVLYAVHK